MGVVFCRKARDAQREGPGRQRRPPHSPRRPALSAGGGGSSSRKPLAQQQQPQQPQPQPWHPPTPLPTGGFSLYSFFSSASSSSSSSWSSSVIDAVVGSTPARWSVLEQATAKLDRTERIACGDSSSSSSRNMLTRHNRATPRGVPRLLLGDATPLCDHVHDVTLLEISARHMSKVYNLLVSRGLWDAVFARGRRPRSAVAATTAASSAIVAAATAKRKLIDQDDDDNNRDNEEVRSMATAYLGRMGTDAWNAMAGAIELARVWGLTAKTTSEPQQPQQQPQRPGAPRPRAASDILDRETRMRLAVCLSVAWKFARSNSVLLYRDFPPSAGDIRNNNGKAEMRTLELAYVGYAFLLPHERGFLGVWDSANVKALRTLQEYMLELELDLVLNVQMFPLLAENAQLLAEHHAQHLFDNGRLSAGRCMQIRGILPFFLRASLFKRRNESSSLYAEVFGVVDPMPGAKALVCAAWMCVKHADGGSTRDMRSARQLFEPSDFLTAWRLLENAARAAGTDPKFYKDDCYGDDGWYGYPFVSASTLAAAMHACMPGAGSEPERNTYNHHYHDHHHDHRPHPDDNRTKQQQQQQQQHARPLSLLHVVTQACLG